MGIKDLFASNTYNLNMKCQNCKKIGIRKVPKGVSIKEYMESCPPCTFCGCEKLELINKSLLQ